MNLFKRSLGAATALSMVVSFVGPMTASAAGPDAVDLSSAGDFVILAKSGISSTGATLVVGDIGVSPVSATAITGFGLDVVAGSAFATSSQVTGHVYAPGYADPTSSMLTTAVGDMETAYTDGAGRTNPTATELGAGNIGGLTIAPGLYKWSTGVTIPSDVTLSGNANDVWIFQIAETLTMSSATSINLSGGAQAGNIFWIVAGQTTIGTTAEFNGNILGQTAIVFGTGATLHGRALAQTAVTLDANAIAIADGGTVSSDDDVSSDDVPVSNDDEDEVAVEDEVTVEDEDAEDTDESDAAAGITRDRDDHRVSRDSGVTGLSPFDQTTQPISEVETGWFIRSKNFDTVYVVDSNGMRHPFWNTQTYFTWSDSWDDVVWVTDATLSTLPLGSPILPKPGVVLVKIVSDPSVYAVEVDTDGSSELRHVPSESVAKAVYGQRWADNVIDVEPTLFSHYSQGADVSASESINLDIMKTRVEIAGLSN